MLHVAYYCTYHRMLVQSVIRKKREEKTELQKDRIFVV